MNPNQALQVIQAALMNDKLFTAPLAVASQVLMALNVVQMALMTSPSVVGGSDVKKEEKKNV